MLYFTCEQRTQDRRDKKKHIETTCVPNKTAHRTPHRIVQRVSERHADACEREFIAIIYNSLDRRVHNKHACMCMLARTKMQVGCFVIFTMCYEINNHSACV